MTVIRSGANRDAVRSIISPFAEGYFFNLIGYMKKISDLGVLLLAVAIFSGCGKAESRYVETHAVSSASTTAQDTLPLAGDTASENQSERLAVADGRKEENASNATAADTKFINRVFKQSEAAILKLSKFGCDKGTKQGVDVKGIVKGSFTKPETQETAYLYERCRPEGALALAAWS